MYPQFEFELVLATKFANYGVQYHFRVLREPKVRHPRIDQPFGGEPAAHLWTVRVDRATALTGTAVLAPFASGLIQIGYFQEAAAHRTRTAVAARVLPLREAFVLCHRARAFAAANRFAWYSII